MHKPDDRRPLADLVEPDPLEARTPEGSAARLRVALELADAGVEMMRQNLRRRHPQADDREIDRRLEEWLRDRPGAEHGDAWGQPGVRAFGST